MAVPQKPALHLASLSNFSAGMNSDVPAIALANDQLSFANNATLRGNYFTNRPPFLDFDLTFSAGVQTPFEDGIFQGACYYKPDYGQEAIVASIGGRLFQVTPAINGNDAEIIEVTPASGGASDTLSIAWLWQSERWVIRQDGQAVPMFFDGNTTRYAKTGDEVVGTVSVQAVTPNVDSSVAVTLDGAGFTGQYGKTYNVFNPNVVTPIGKFQVSQYANPTTTLVRLTNLTDAPGANHLVGELIEVTHNYSGTATSGATIPPGGSGTIGITPQFTGSIGSVLHWGVSGNFVFRVTAINGLNITILDINGDPTQKLIGIGNPFQLTPSVPNSLVATITANFTAPAIGATVDVQVDSAYAGANGQYVEIEGQLYMIAAIVPASGATNVLLTNISANPTAVILANATIQELAELPTSRAGVYGLGRNWECFPDKASYLASDIVGGTSGSIAEQFRDSVLNVTENSYLAGGGVFRVPGAGVEINAMAFPATLDSSLGQGPLQVLTQNVVFSCNAPVERAQWQTITNPIQTQSLVSAGAVSFYGTTLVNSDIWFRSGDGIRSLKLARQEFQTGFSNTPQSMEVSRTIAADDRSLLYKCSSINFDNRLLMTANPIMLNGNVYHTKLIAINLDPISSLREKTPPIYDGIWEGRNILQMVVGTFGGVERAFAFTLNTTDETIGLTELIPSERAIVFDNDEDRIQSYFESPALFYNPDTATRDLLRLDDGEMIVKDLVGDVRFDVYYRPDYDTAWHPWHSWEVTDSPTWQPRMGLGSPDYKQGDAATGRPYAVGYSFQVRVVITGRATLLGMNFFAVTTQETTRAKPLPSLTPLTI